ncbi:LURP-one-related family protein [Aerococcaceae bacterium DSM 111022]|nr:LURP-one-related family protein [Aerococcaceae bacterium DSM 111022]
MKFYMKQKLLSWRESHSIYDENQNPVFQVEGKLLSWGKQLRLTDIKSGEHIVDIKEKVIALLPKMLIEYQGKHVATVQKELTFFKPKYKVPELGWKIEGDYLQHDYQIFDDRNKLIADINKKFFAWSDTFEFDIKDTQVPFAVVIGVILAIDMAMDEASN